jgi:hypothetical protein
MRISKLFAVTTLAALALITAGCAAFSTKRSQMVVVRSAPADAITTINGQAVGTTPFKVRLERDQAYRIEVSKPGFASQTAVVLPSTEKYDQRFLKWGLDYQLGAAKELVPGDLIMMLKPDLGETVNADRYVELTAQINQADALLASGQISASDHKLIVEQITKAYAGQ